MADPTASEDVERADAQAVDDAVEALSQGDFDRAEALLQPVIDRTPAAYVHEEARADGLSIRFWDQLEFVHYVTWHLDQGKEIGNVSWVYNAYPRAHFYMGFLCVKRKQFARAIDYLDRGLALEPTNPKFRIEKAKALMLSGRHADSVALYDQVSEIGPYTSAHDAAVALRGRGFALIESNDLDRAEDSFRRSLVLEPDNTLAHHELRYIGHLRKGGSAAPPRAVPSETPDLSVCALCGASSDKGTLLTLRETPVMVCERCEKRFKKKWWQFWR